ncbi:MAG: hypothetical protein I8H71_13420 [Xanthomonadaceae bacterium]|nr:hypothetical protein [Xanthomonadaceae bacterium]
MTCKFLNFCALASAEQAAWVQAIGSLIAIAIAIAVPLFIDHLTKRRIDKEKNSRSKALALSILPDLYKLKASTSHFINETTNPNDEATREIDELNGDYFAHAENFKKILAAMPDLGQYGAKLSSLVYLIFRANEMIAIVTRLQASGYHSAYINNIDEFVEFARSIDAATAEIIKEIESSHDKP